MTEFLQSDQATSTPAVLSGSGFDFLSALVQLGLGGASIGASVVREPGSLQDALTAGEAGQVTGSLPVAAPAPPESPMGRLVDGAVGAAAGTQQVMRSGAARVWGINKRLVRAVAAPIRQPMDALGVTDVVRGPVDAVTGRVQSAMGTLEEIGRAELQESGLRAGRTLAGTIDAVVAYLAQSPAVDALIRVQIDKLLPLLATHPAVERLIQVQVDKILPLLENSAAIRSLILAQVDQILPELADSAGVQALILAQVDKILPELADNAGVQALILAQVDKILPELAESSEVQALIDAQVSTILPKLADNTQVQDLILAQVDAILPKLSASPEVQDLIDAQVKAILPKLADDMQIQELIRKQAGAYLFYLSNHSEQIQALIRQQGDAYIEYLNAHPDAVQALVSGQSLGIAGQVMDEVRERTVTADSVAETLVRSILRKKARADIEPPPEPVQRRAAVGVLPSDYITTSKERPDGQ